MVAYQPLVVKSLRAICTLRRSGLLTSLDTLHWEGYIICSNLFQVGWLAVPLPARHGPANCAGHAETHPPLPQELNTLAQRYRTIKPLLEKAGAAGGR